MSPLSNFVRIFAPLLRVQPAAAPAALLSMRAWFASLHSSTSTSGSSITAGTPVDMFTEKLQHKTEQEILELLERGRDQADAPEGSQAGEQQVSGRVAQEETGEIGGPKGPEPTRFGDWEIKGRVSDF